MSIFRWAFFLLLAGCAGWVRTDLLFGRCKPRPAGAAQCPLVSDEEWQQFVDREIAPRFSEGFSVVTSEGEWKGSDGIVREPSKILIVLHHRDPSVSKKLDEIRDAYKKQFQQDAVMRVDICAHVAF